MKREIFAQIETLDYEIQKLHEILDKYGLEQRITTRRITAALDAIWQKVETEVDE